MKRIKLVGETLPRIKLTDPGVRRLDPTAFAVAIGAEPMTDEEALAFQRRHLLANKAS